MEQDITNALSGRAGLDGICWLLLDAQPQELLRRELAALLPSAALLGDGRLHRAKYKPGRYLQAYYDLTINGPGASERSTRAIEVLWTPAGMWQEQPPAARAMQEEAINTGLAAPFRQLMAEAPAHGLRIQVAPLDAEFPNLVRLSDPRYVREVIAAAHAIGNGLKSGLSSSYAVTPVRYRPGQRHVLRYDPAEGFGAGTIFAKVYNSDKGARTFSVATRIADWLIAKESGITVARPWAYVAEERLVLYPLVTGTPLTDLLRDANADTARLLQLSGAALRTIHQTPESLVELKPHDFAAEVKAIARAAEHLRPLLPATAERITAILDRGRALYEQLPQEPPTFAYGDFKADHLWLTASGLTMIDFDTCYRFDPAIDIGKFLADLHYWYDGLGRTGVADAREQFLAGYAHDIPPDRLLRARVFEALVLIKSTVRRVRLFDDDWAPRTERLIERAAAVLEAI